MCKPGDIFAVDVYEVRYERFSRQTLSEKQKLPYGIKQRANTSYFAAYIPQKKVVLCLNSLAILGYVLDSEHDGVIYILRHPTDVATTKEVSLNQRKQVTFETFKSITGDTTKARIYKVAEWLKKKRGNDRPLESDSMRIRQ